MSDHRYVYKVYHTLKLDYEDGKTNWVLCVKQLLYSCGLGEAWVSQSVGSDNVFMSLFKRRVFDMYQQDWNSRLSSTSRGTLYTNINIDVYFLHVSYKHFESVKLSSDMYSLIKLRTSSHFYRKPSMYTFVKLLSDANLVTRNRLATIEVWIRTTICFNVIVNVSLSI